MQKFAQRSDHAIDKSNFKILKRNTLFHGQDVVAMTKEYVIKIR